MNKEELYRKALDKWGESAQILLAIEEMGELIQVLSKSLNGRRRMPDIRIEIADVQIMIEQLRLIFGGDPIDEIVEVRLERLSRLIKPISKDTSEGKEG